MKHLIHRNIRYLSSSSHCQSTRLASFIQWIRSIYPTCLLSIVIFHLRSVVCYVPAIFYMLPIVIHVPVISQLPQNTCRIYTRCYKFTFRSWIFHWIGMAPSRCCEQVQCQGQRTKIELPDRDQLNRNRFFSFTHCLLKYYRIRLKRVSSFLLRIFLEVFTILINSQVYLFPDPNKCY